MSRPAAEDDSPLTISEAASMAAVSESTIRSWIKTKRIGSELVHGAFRIDRSAFRNAKILRKKSFLDCAALLEVGVEWNDIARAIDAGAVVPSEPTRCFSLNDRAVVRSFKLGTWKAPNESVTAPAADEPDGTDDDFEQRLGRWPALRAYLFEHGDPTRLPAHFWETRLCPEFVPPVGVFRYTYGQLADFQNGMAVSVKRSEGWSRRGSKLRFVPERDAVMFLQQDEWTPGAEPPQYQSQNLRWRSLRVEWRQAWFQHRRELLARGIDIAGLPDVEPTGGRNRRAVLRRYHEEHWSPSELPDWFWDAKEPPPFDPPTGVERLEYGEQQLDPSGSGQLGTWIRWSGMWQHPIGDPVHLSPPDDRFEWVPGRFDMGSTPEQYGEVNREYDLALAEWNEAYHAVQQLLRGER